MNVLSNPVFWQGCVVGIALGIFLCAYVLARNLRQSMSGDRKCLIDGPSWLAAWKAIGQKGKPTYKGLHALFATTTP